MARDDDNTLMLVMVGLGAYFVYQYFKQYGFHFQNPFSATGGAPGILPFGAGGTAPGGTGGEGNAPTGGAPTETQAPAAIGPGGESGTLMCVNETTGRVDVMNPDGTCPPGSKLTLVVNLVQ